ncbi:MAG: sugar phosphate isomerase/epimerase, partial [Candidatus Flemingiibacterium sp.]
MKLSVLANCYGNKTLDEALAIFSKLGVEAVEIGAGGYPGKAHCNPAVLLKDEDEFKKFMATFDK